MTSRYVAFIDESSDADVYRVGALLVPAEAERGLVDALEAVAASLAVFGMPESTELHGHEMFHGVHDWEALHRKPRARIGIYAKAMAAVGEHSEGVFIRGVDRAAFKRKYSHRPDWNEHENALTFTLEALDDYLEGVDGRATVFADNCRFERTTLRHFERFKESGTWGFRARRLDRLDSLDYIDSAENRQIQAADLVCYMNHRIHSRRDLDPRARAANEKIWAPVRPLVKVNRDWRPR